MIAQWLDIDHGIFLDLYIVEVALSDACSRENRVYWSEKPSCFLLHLVDVFELLQIVIGELFAFYVLANFLPDFGLDFRMLGEKVNHHGQICGGGVDTRCEESIEFRKDAFIVIAQFIFFFLPYVILHHCFNQIFELP